MEPFVWEAPASRVVFGTGSVARVAAECAALDLRRVLVIAGGSASAAGDQIAELLGPACAGRFPQVVPHVPEELVAQAAQLASERAADGLCSVGGGSATGLAKAVAVTAAEHGRSALPVVAVPTTYAGSEATAVYGVTGQRKRTAVDPRTRPRTVIYDPALTVDLPAAATAASGFNALAHATAALAGPGHQPMARLHAREAVRLLARSLPAAVSRPGDLPSRGELLWAAWLAGSALAATGTGLHHRLCHVLGGAYRLPHAALHAVLLPHTVAHDPALETAPVAEALQAAGAMGSAAEVGEALWELGRRVGRPGGLADLGLPPDQLDPAAQLAHETLGNHDEAWFRAVLTEAYHDRTAPAERPHGRSAGAPD